MRCNLWGWRGKRREGVILLGSVKVELVSDSVCIWFLGLGVMDGRGT